MPWVSEENPDGIQRHGKEMVEEQDGIWSETGFRHSCERIVEVNNHSYKERKKTGLTPRAMRLDPERIRRHAQST